MVAHFSDDVPDLASRISPRNVFETRMRICLQPDSQSLTLAGWIRDLSEGGLPAFVAYPLVLGEQTCCEGHPHRNEKYQNSRYAPSPE